MLQNSIACFQEFYPPYDSICLSCCIMLLPEAKLMIVSRGAFQKLQWIKGLLVSRMSTH
jgi:hypothetical protein